MSTANLDPDLLATLTDEERAAFDDATPEEIESLKNVSGAVKEGGVVAAPADDDDDDADDDGDDEAPAGDAAAAAPAEEAAAAAAPAEAPAAPVEAAAAAAPEPAQPAMPPAFRYDLPADFEDRLKANTEADDALQQRFEDGEITREEFRAEQRRIADERRELDSMRMRHEVAADMQRQAQEQVRTAAVTRLVNFAKTPDGGGIDYAADQAKFKDLDTFVRVLANDPANEDKPLDWFLTEAHRRVRVLHNITGQPTPTPTPTPTPSAADAKAAAAAARKPAVGEVPPTLAQIPGGDGPGDVGGEFDDILGLDGEDYERAIENMARRDPVRFARFQASKQ